MNGAFHAALERALLFAIALAGSESALRLFEEENRIALFLLPEVNRVRVRQAWRSRHARVTARAPELPPAGPVVRDAKGS
jgi:hypothetical protein